MIVSLHITCERIDTYKYNSSEAPQWRSGKHSLQQKGSGFQAACQLEP